jgi:hypothetical protein
MAALDVLPESDYKQALLALASFSVQRSYWTLLDRANQIELILFAHTNFIVAAKNSFYL